MVNHTPLYLLICKINESLLYLDTKLVLSLLEVYNSPLHTQITEKTRHLTCNVFVNVHLVDFSQFAYYLQFF